MSTNQVAILKAFQARLIDKIPVFNINNCYITDEPLPHDTEENQFSFLVGASISPIEGTYDERQQIGGAPCGLIERGGIEVTVFAREGMDEPIRLDFALTESNQGVLTQLKPRVLDAILIDRVGASQNKQRWSPKNADGSAMLASEIMVIRSSAPRRIYNWPFIGLAISFGTEWNWKF